jgi:hypothetical protein
MAAIHDCGLSQKADKSRLASLSLTYTHQEGGSIHKYRHPRTLFTQSYFMNTTWFLQCILAYPNSTHMDRKKCARLAASTAPNLTWHIRLDRPIKNPPLPPPHVKNYVPFMLWFDFLETNTNILCFLTFLHFYTWNCYAVKVVKDYVMRCLRFVTVMFRTVTF